MSPLSPISSNAQQAHALYPNSTVPHDSNWLAQWPTFALCMTVRCVVDCTFVLSRSAVRLVYRPVFCWRQTRYALCPCHL